MKSLSRLLLAVLILTIAAPGAPPTASQIESILKDLSTISGFPVKRQVPFGTISRSELQKYLEKRLLELNAPDQLRADEITLKKFGLVPPSFDLAKSSVDLLTEQAAAFYDDDKHKLFLVEGGGSALEELSLVHELAHALADQQYPLGKFVRKDVTSDDAQLARTAVVEGQAMWLMLEYTLSKTGQSLRENASFLKLFRQSTELDPAQFPVLEKTPLYLREMLLFPYSAGLEFQQALVERSGKKAFGEVFEHPPSSTQQVIHPERYGESPGERTAPLGSWRPPAGFRKLNDGGIGEFDHRVMLRQYGNLADKGQELAASWRAGQFVLWEEQPGRARTVLLYASRWDTASHARQWFEQYQRILKGKWKRYRVTESSANRITGEGDDGSFVLVLDQTLVQSTEGLPELPNPPASPVK